MDTFAEKEKKVNAYKTARGEGLLSISTAVFLSPSELRAQSPSSLSDTSESGERKVIQQREEVAKLCVITCSLCVCAQSKKE